MVVYRPQSFKVTKLASVMSHMPGDGDRSEAPRVTMGGLSGQGGPWRPRRESVEEQLTSFEIAARRSDMDRWGAHRPRRPHRRRHHPSDHPGDKNRDQTRVSIIDGHTSRVDRLEASTKMTHLDGKLHIGHRGPLGVRPLWIHGSPGGHDPERAPDRTVPSNSLRSPHHPEGKLGSGVVFDLPRHGQCEPNLVVSRRRTVHRRPGARTRHQDPAPGPGVRRRRAVGTSAPRPQRRASR